MNVKSCEKKENKTAELSVLVAPEEFDKALEESYRKNRARIFVPGFRKGKAPRKIIEKMYGESVFYGDAFDIILPAACSHGVSEAGLRVVGSPEILDLSVGEDKSATVTFSVHLYPEITVRRYKGLSAAKPAVAVEESQVDSEIASVRLRNARIQTADRPAVNGDTVVIDFEGFIDGKPFDGGKGEDYELTLGSNTFIPGFEERIQGMRAGEEREIELAFPEDYREDLAGRPVVFRVKVKEVREKILPELDDEFAKDVSEFDTLEEYKNSIREKLTEERQKQAEKAFEENVLAKLAEEVEGDIPDIMVEEQIDRQLENLSRQLAQYGMELSRYLGMMGYDLNDYRERMRPGVLARIKTTLALEKVAELENLQPTEEDIEKYYEDAAREYGVEVSAAKNAIPRDAVLSDLKLKMASDLVRDNAVAVEQTEAAGDEATDTESPAEGPAEA